MIDIAAILAATDLVALIRQRVKLTKRGREFVGLCPFHAEKTPSFAVVPSKGFFHCHGCAAHGDALDWIMRIEGCTLPQAAERLGGSPVDPETAQRLATEQKQRNAEHNREHQRELALNEYRNRNPDCVVPDWAILTP